LLLADCSNFVVRNRQLFRLSNSEAVRLLTAHNLKDIMGAFIALPIMAYGIIRLLFYLLAG
jgi:hypothetical protein